MLLSPSQLLLGSGTFGSTSLKIKVQTSSSPPLSSWSGHASLLLSFQELIPDPRHNWQHFKLSAMAAEAVRFAFVGCGIIARHHLGALKQSSHATAVTAVVDVNRKRAEELLKLLPRPEEQSNTERCKVIKAAQTLIFF